MGTANDLVAVATRVPDGVICLISALAFHELTTQIPHLIDIAIVRDTPESRPTRDIDLLGFLDGEFQAMVFLGTLNSRMKDFYDIWLLARQFDFVGAELAAAIDKTFRNRKTVLEESPVALTEAFTRAKRPQQQWTAFLRRSNLDSAPSQLDDLRQPLRAFLLPVAKSLIADDDFNGSWAAGGPWIR